MITHIDADEAIALVQMRTRAAVMQAGPPATAKALEEYVQQNPSDVHGAIVFDLFVANNDRAFKPERRNLALDRDGKLQLFDQGNACFYRPRPQAGIVAGIPRLDAVESDMESMFDMAHKRNYYFELLTNWTHVEYWCDRIKQLPDFLIETAVNRIPSALPQPTADERSRLVDFLMQRRERLLDDIIGAKGRFPGLGERKGRER